MRNQRTARIRSGSRRTFETGFHRLSTGLVPVRALWTQCAGCRAIRALKGPWSTSSTRQTLRRRGQRNRRRVETRDPCGILCQGARVSPRLLPLLCHTLIPPIPAVEPLAAPVRKKAPGAAWRKIHMFLKTDTTGYQSLRR